MAKTKYIINLNIEQRNMLTKLVCEARESNRTIMRAKILLMSDATQAEKQSIRELAERLGTTETTVKTVRTVFATQGLDAALYRKERLRKVTSEIEQAIIELAASEPPAGHKKWSSRLLCEVAIERRIVDHIVSSTVCKILREQD
ncbi:MAG: helix-turn-helix domain-containing protein [Lachnospiraceae bacterium]|uniref:Helix-turn-helix domain-containing protein n=1 Tax=Porcincola intestinalis TaxID=2606632 RepID=A0A6L5X0L7_9FIRM|nr:helix-turn-helix domain-containing protein [Porcincola intestinalis]MCI6767118.1 helix-turn-helix domain-containing protein [Lachnospiraceae bacterium]MSS13810.1 helix-turn-helix domain-containing protein [Porcincola intestinalis]